jgi:hypothetical protein
VAKVPRVRSPEKLAVPPQRSIAVTWRWAISGSAATTWSSVSAANWPAAIRSRRAGPSRGSVTFWVQAAPTPARVWAQRAATAGLDEEIAIPNEPVSAHRAAIEKVMPPPSG